MTATIFYIGAIIFLAIGPCIILIGLIVFLFKKWRKKTNFLVPKGIVLCGLVTTILTYVAWAIEILPMQEEYTKTECVVYRINEYEDTTMPSYACKFKYNNDMYIAVDGYFYDFADPDTLYYTSEEALKGTPENLRFNLRDKPGIKTILFGPSYENVYELPNDSGCVLYTTEENIYCKESDLNIALQYYEDLGVQ